MGHISLMKRLGQAIRFCSSAVMAVIIVIGTGYAMILRTALVSSCMITEEQGKVTSQTLCLIRSRDLNIYLEAHPELIQAELQPLPVPEYTLRLHIQAVKGHDTWDLLPMIYKEIRFTGHPLKERLEISRKKRASSSL